MTDGTETIERDDDVIVRPWIKRGHMLVNALALDIDDPDHIYNQILAQGKEPEAYGYKHPYTEEFEGKNRDELIREIIQLRKEIEGWCRADASGLLYRKY